MVEKLTFNLFCCRVRSIVEKAVSSGMFTANVWGYEERDTSDQLRAIGLEEKSANDEKRKRNNSTTMRM